MKEPRTLEFEPYAIFTENPQFVQATIAGYRDEIVGLATPVSAGWPYYLEGVLIPGQEVIGFDINARQIGWYQENYPNQENISLFAGDISTNNTLLQGLITRKTNFLFVSNIPDWLAGVTGKADRSSPEVHQERINSFIEMTLNYLQLSIQDKKSRFLLISSCKNEFLDQLSTIYVNQSSLDIIIRRLNSSGMYLTTKAYPICNYLLIETHPLSI